MKALTIGFASLLLVTNGASAAAKHSPQQRGDVALLQRGLGVVATQAQIAATPAPKTTDNDQGDDQANPRAIERVCNHDNPSAVRSAICPVSISPQ